MREAALDRLREAIPMEFHRKPDPEQLHNPGAHQAVLDWFNSPRPYDEDTGTDGCGGLVLFGRPGSGKTRAACDGLWTVMEEFPGMKFAFWRMPDLVNRVRKLTMRRAAADAQADAEALEDLRDELTDPCTDYLILDDLDKLPSLSGRVGELIFDVIDTRLSNHSLTIFTLQRAGPALVKKLRGYVPDGEDRGVAQDEAEALADRLNPARGLCLAIDFDAVQPGPSAQPAEPVHQ